MAGAVGDPSCDTGLVLVLGRAVGLRRVDLWTYHAISRYVARDGDRLGSYHGDWHDRAADISWHARGITFLGIALSVAGVIIVARAGRAKERESAAEESQVAIAEFNFGRGIVVAVFSGIMSSCFAFGLDAGAPIRELTLAAGTPQ